MKTIEDQNENHYKNKIAQINDSFVEITVNKNHDIYEIDKIRSIKLIKEKKIFLNSLTFFFLSITYYFIAIQVINFWVDVFLVLTFLLIMPTFLFYNTDTYILQIRLKCEKKIKYQIKKSQKNETLLFLNTFDYYKLYAET